MYTLKSTAEGIEPKARLVARGYEEYNNDIQTDSPTCAHESLRVIISVLANRSWKIHSMDIKTAFLQGENMERNVYIKPPKEAKCNDKIWRLNKCVYGLTDASLSWYKRVKSVLTECGGVMSKVDPSVFYWTDSTGEVCGILACHVDDFIWGGTDKFENEVISKIRSVFKVGKESTETFQFCGIDLFSDGESTYMSQDKYAESLKTIQLNEVRLTEKDSDLTEEEMHSLRSKIGQLLWIAHQSRPDLLFDVISVATNVKRSKIKDILMVNKIIVKAKSLKMSMKFQKLGDCNKLSLTVFSDASLGNMSEGGSQGGFIILLTSETNKCSPIWWNSKKIRRVVRSSLAAETLAMSEGIDTAVYHYFQN